MITGGLDIAAPDRNRATSFVHNGLGQVVRQAAYLVELVENNDDPPVLEPVVRMQETAYIYDAARLLASDIASNDLLAELHYPDTQRITIGAPIKLQPTLLDNNRQGEVVSMREFNQLASDGADWFVVGATHGLCESTRYMRVTVGRRSVRRTDRRSPAARHEAVGRSPLSAEGSGRSEVPRGRRIASRVRAWAARCT